MADRLPGEQASFGARQQPVRESRADAAAVEIHDLAVLAAGEDHPPAEGVAALLIDQTGVEQQIERIALGGEMASQISAASVADAQFFDDGGVAQSSLFQIANRFRMLVELHLEESGRFFQYGGAVSRRDLGLQIGNALAKRQTLPQLDEPDQVAAAAATMAVEQVLAAVDIERGLALRVQGTQAQELGATPHAACLPVTAQQVIQQRQT